VFKNKCFNVQVTSEEAGMRSGSSRASSVGELRQSPTLSNSIPHLHNIIFMDEGRLGAGCSSQGVPDSCPW